jgi:hypothetical protein
MKPVTDPALLAELDADGAQAPAGLKPVSDPALLELLEGPRVSQLGAFGEGVGQGATLGFADEIGAAADASGLPEISGPFSAIARPVIGAVRRLVSDQGEADYNASVERRRAKIAASEEQHPGTFMAGTIAGGVATAPIMPAATVAKGAALGARVVGGIKTGAGYGAAYGVGTGEGLEDRLSRGATGAVIGGATGGVLGIPGRSAAAPNNAVVDAAERIGVALPRAAASESMTVQRAGQTLANVPVAGNSLKRASSEAIEGIGQAANRTSAAYSRAGTPTSQEAGSVLREGIENYIGPATTARGKKLYDQVDNFVQPNATAPLTATTARVAQIEAERQAAALAPSAASQIVQEATQRQGGLTYQGVKKLRESVGEMLKGGPLPGNISQKELQALYGALSDDLRNVVQTAGGQKGLAAFERANKYHRLVSERRENLARLLKAPSEEGVLEKILASASSSARSDISLLSQARKALPKDEWDEIASAAVSRLGASTKNGGEFSPEKFVTDYAKLSDAGKSLLFRSTGKADLAKALDDIATVSGRFKELQKFANPSGTGQTVIGGAAGYGLLAEPVTAISSLLGAAVASKILATPATARSMAQWSRAYHAAVVRPSKATAVALNRSSQAFGASIGQSLGLKAYTDQIVRALQSVAAEGRVAADPQQDNER